MVSLLIGLSIREIVCFYDRSKLGGRHQRKIALLGWGQDFLPGQETDQLPARTIACVRLSTPNLLYILLITHLTYYPGQVIAIPRLEVIGIRRRMSVRARELLPRLSGICGAAVSMVTERSDDFLELGSSSRALPFEGLANTRARFGLRSASLCCAISDWSP